MQSAKKLMEPILDDDYSSPLPKPRKGRGRPPHEPAEQKRPHNMALSNEAWDKLESLSKKMGAGSVSRLIENIGLEKIEIQWASCSGLQSSRLWLANKTIFGSN